MPDKFLHNVCDDSDGDNGDYDDIGINIDNNSNDDKINC